MRLTHLKLSGFKSFVDVTTLSFPSQLMTIVGPNGCGKSNLIDAVRWVLGESSAKNLRGGAMTDVIFNGTTHRKAVGQASVELKFDNSLSQLSGQFASYQEIAVKRLINRDGESSYYLNGTRCRRKDVHDLFLGTGSGPRGYAIIGQEKISQIIESKPEALRVYLEEAAGVSKYKERRRETLLRIEHTLSNLERVADLCKELDKQLSKLSRQAQNASLYKDLKEKERQLLFDLRALKWQHLIQNKTDLEKTVDKWSAEYDLHQADLKQFAADKKKIAMQTQQFRNDIQAIQDKYYEMSQAIARIEESIVQKTRETERLTNDHKQLSENHQTLLNTLTQDQKQFDENSEVFNTLKQDSKKLEQKYAAQQKLFSALKQQADEWYAQRQDIESGLVDTERQREYKMHLYQGILHRCQQAEAQLKKLKQQLQSLDKVSLIHQVNGFKKEKQALQKQLQALCKDDDKIKSEVQQLKTTVAQNESKLKHLEKELSHLAAQKMIHKAGYDSQLGKINDLKHKNDSHTRTYLLDKMHVTPQWSKACEMVLGDYLKAILVEENFDKVLEELPAYQGYNATFVLPARQANPSGPVDNCSEDFTTPTFCGLSAESIDPADKPRGVGCEVNCQQTLKKQNKSHTLDGQISGVLPSCLGDLSKIYLADSLKEAILRVSTLKDSESVVTQEGFWLSTKWIRIQNFSEPDEQGLLLKKQKIHQIETEYDAVKTKLELLQKLLKQQTIDLDNISKQSKKIAEKKLACKDLLSDCESNIQKYELEKAHVVMQLSYFNEEIKRLEKDIEAFTAEKMQTQKDIKDLDETIQSKQQTLKAWLQQKQVWEPDLEKHMQIEKALKEACEANKKRFQKTHEENLQLQTRIKITNQQLIEQTNYLNTLQNRLQEIEEPGVSIKETLQSKQKNAKDLQQDIQKQQAALKELEQTHKILERKEEKSQFLANSLLEKIQEKKLEMNLLSARARDLKNPEKDNNISFEQRIKKLSRHNVAETEEDLSAIRKQLERLGAVNFVAIEEYQLESKRKQVIDEQYRDLQEALATLQQAIQEIDNETKNRFQETFSAINESFQTLFPRLFGGGYAKLELTSNDLLEAGVQVTARPPGKKNSIIQMLSGGEKALTAVALLFAIFQLNPAPFCMLDEIDAPLDDANVWRLCEIIREMSRTVQFLLITHNKTTMTIAEHIYGITMSEPGVSRLVSVDVKKVLVPTDSRVC